MTTIYIILAVLCGIVIVTAMLVVKALRECEDNSECITTLAEKQVELRKTVYENEQKLCHLADCHDTEKTGISYWAINDFPAIYTHYREKAETKTANGVTLEELAKLVLDGTPIVRDVPTKTKYGVHKDETNATTAPISTGGICSAPR